MAQVSDGDLFSTDLQEWYAFNTQYIQLYLNDPKFQTPDYKNDFVTFSKLDSTFTITKKLHFIKFGGVDSLLNQSSTEKIHLVSDSEPVSNHVTNCMDDIQQHNIYNFNQENNTFEHININDPAAPLDKLSSSSFINLFNDTFCKYFTDIECIESISEESKNVLNKKFNTKTVHSINEINTTDYIKLLLYRMSIHNIGIISFFGKLFNMDDMILLWNRDSMRIYDNTLKTISFVSYLNIRTGKGDLIIGKVIISMNVNSINKYGFCLIELNYDLDDTSSFVTNTIEYLINIYSKIGSINILQNLALKNKTDSDISMKTAREDVGNLMIGSIDKNTTGFFEKDCSGKTIEKTFFKILKKQPKTCYHKTYKMSNNLNKNEKLIYEKSVNNICTYNGLLNFHKEEEDEVKRMPGDQKIITQIKNFYKIFENIASNLLIVTDIETIFTIFQRFNLLSSIKLSSLDFILITSTEITLYIKKSNRVADRNTKRTSVVSEYSAITITKKVSLIPELNPKPHQNIYIIVQAVYDKKPDFTSMIKSVSKTPDIFDPPILLSEINNSILPFLDFFKTIYKSGINIIVSSYLSRSILTAAIISVSLKAKPLKFGDINHISILKIFLATCIFRNSKSNMVIAKPVFPVKNKKTLFDEIFDEVYSLISTDFDSIKITPKKLLGYYYSENSALSANKPIDELKKFNITPEYYDLVFTQLGFIPGKAFHIQDCNPGVSSVAGVASVSGVSSSLPSSSVSPRTSSVSGISGLPELAENSTTDPPQINRSTKPPPLINLSTNIPEWQKTTSAGGYKLTTKKKYKKTTKKLYNQYKSKRKNINKSKKNKHTKK